MNLSDLTPSLVGAVPTAVAVLVALLVGIVGAALARRVAVWLVKRLRVDVLAERAGSAKMLYAIGVRRNVPQLVGTLAYGGVLLLTAAVVAELLGLPSIAVGIGRVLDYLPRLITAVLILLGGLVLADVVRSLVKTVASRRDDLDSPDLVGNLVYYAVVVVALSMAAGHLGIDTALVNSLIEVGFGAAALSVGVLVALAGRHTARNVISRHYAARMFRKGDLIEIDGQTGELVDFGPQSAWLRTATGMVVVPCTRLTEGIVHTHIDETSP